MSKCLSIVRHEYSMGLKRPATWGVLLAACVIALIDNLPTAGNLTRLEFLTEPAYFIYRTMSLDALILIFGLMFLLSSRFSLDEKTGVKPLIMAGPVTKAQYIFGKLLGGFLYSFTFVALFLFISIAAYIVAAPFDVSLADCATPFFKALAVSALPVSFFVGFVSVSLPAVMNIRLFYLLVSGLFFFNAASVGSAEKMPCYLITSGDLIKLVWQHPRFPNIDSISVAENLVFLLGCGIAALLPLFLKRSFWRAEG